MLIRLPRMVLRQERIEELLKGISPAAVTNFGARLPGPATRLLGDSIGIALSLIGAYMRSLFVSRPFTLMQAPFIPREGWGFAGSVRKALNPQYQIRQAFRSLGSGLCSDPPLIRPRNVLG